MTSQTATDVLDGRAAELLATLAGPAAALRPDQLAAIRALVGEHRRVLVVQRTGWGKSAVYFIATRLLRDAGAGPTLLVSPLLALMRDQIAAATRIGLRAETINSTNIEQWEEVVDRLHGNAVDLLLISPERLNHPGFRRAVLPRIAATVGLLVVDEAHCISDWGHDFRPDYRRITSVLAGLPDDVAVLATTATANDRVLADVTAQLGAQPLTLRGPLDRDSLVLSVRHLPGAAARLAWLAEWIPTTAGSGIVYCLTVADTERVAAWLVSHGIAAAAYSGQTDKQERERIESDLGANRLKVVAATTALAMGYDKPDLAFVVHYGMPSSPIAYYQAIGRAGRALPHADVVLLPGEADRAIWAYFDATALPPQHQIEAVLDALAQSPRTVPALEQSVNLRRGRLEAMLKVLDVEGVVSRVMPGDSSTGRRQGGAWRATGRPWVHDGARLRRVDEARKAEQAAMLAYARTDTCLMAFLRAQLDDPEAEVACGRCANCVGQQGSDPPNPALATQALRFLRDTDVIVEPRKTWPAGVPGRRGGIRPHQRAEPGRALGIAGDPAWAGALSELFRAGTEAAVEPPQALLDEVLDGVTAALARWDWAARPTWVTSVPSRRRPQLVAAIAEGIAARGRLPLRDSVQRVADTPRQVEMDNSTHQCANALRAFTVDGSLPAGPALVVDDELNSGWTMAVVAALLREAGADSVLPFVLQRRP